MRKGDQDGRRGAAGVAPQGGQWPRMRQGRQQPAKAPVSSADRPRPRRPSAARATPAPAHRRQRRNAPCAPHHAALVLARGKRVDVEPGGESGVHTRVRSKAMRRRRPARLMAHANQAYGAHTLQPTGNHWLASQAGCGAEGQAKDKRVADGTSSVHPARAHAASMASDAIWSQRGEGRGGAAEARVGQALGQVLAPWLERHAQ